MEETSACEKVLLHTYIHGVARLKDDKWVMHAHGRNLGLGPTFPGGPDDPPEIDRSTQDSSTNLTFQVDRYDEFAKPDHMDRASISYGGRMGRAHFPSAELQLR